MLPKPTQPPIILCTLIGMIVGSSTPAMAHDPPFGLPDSPLEWLLVLSISLLYLMPVIIALLRQHHLSLPASVINIFLGWTGVGWLIALAMAAWETRPAERPLSDSAQSFVRHVGGSVIGAAIVVPIAISVAADWRLGMDHDDPPMLVRYVCIGLGIALTVWANWPAIARWRSPTPGAIVTPPGAPQRRRSI